MILALTSLARDMALRGLKHEADKVYRLIKISGIPGITHPVEEVDISGTNNAIDYLRSNRGMTIYLDTPIGAKKWRVNGRKVETPFHYGEVIDIVNPSDDMGWDILLSPAASKYEKVFKGVSYVPSGHNLLPVGYIPVNLDKDEWRRRTESEGRGKPRGPIEGNDKIILSPDGVITNEDKHEIELFFDKIWNFSKIKWLN